MSYFGCDKKIKKIVFSRRSVFLNNIIYEYENRILFNEIMLWNKNHVFQQDCLFK